MNTLYKPSSKQRGAWKTYVLLPACFYLLVILPCFAQEWHEATSVAPWEARSGHSAVVFNNYIWIIGGDGVEWYSPLGDVWRSTNGIDWELVTESAPWAERSFHASIVYDDKIWIIGGLSESETLNDVWYSGDGDSWTRAIEHAAWSARFDHAMVAMGNQIYVLGGGAYQSDVWYSPDGSNWLEATVDAGWLGRSMHASVSFLGQMWILGGRRVFNAPVHFNDVWSSVDGETWNEVTPNAQWQARFNHAVTLLNDQLWLTGGEYGYNWPRENLVWLNDVWCSSDGADWVQATDVAPWPTRSAHASVAFDGKLWVLGGWRGGPVGFEKLNDVWYMTLPGAEGDGEGEALCEGEPAPPMPAGPHAADVDGDWWIDLVELLRVIQFYNLGGLHCAESRDATEDGYLPGAAAEHACTPHASDYLCGPDWQIEISELLRLIQFFNAPGYHLSPGTEDGYAPGAG